MALGPGKYDDVAQQIQEAFAPAACMVIVIAGKRGTGVSAKFDMLSPEQAKILPATLREIADGLELDMATMQN